MDREVEEKLLEDITSAMERLVGAAESLRLATSAAFQRLAPRIEELAQTVVAADGPVSEVASECFNWIFDIWLQANSADFEARYGPGWRKRLEEAALRMYGPGWKALLVASRKKGI